MISGLLWYACLKVRLITCNYQLKEKLQSIKFLINPHLYKKLRNLFLIIQQHAYIECQVIQNQINQLKILHKRKAF